MHPCKSKRHRRHSGSSLVEFAVAFTVLITLVFVPAINLVGLYSLYVSANTLNELQTHDAALRHHEDTQDPNGHVRRELPEYWRASGLGAYAKSVGTIDTKVRYRIADISQYGIVNRWVEISTDITLSPFLAAVYMPISVPGLNAPFGITITSRRLMEDPTNAPPLASVGGSL